MSYNVIFLFVSIQVFPECSHEHKLEQSSFLRTYPLLALDGSDARDAMT
jgi:hypothetical protein